MNALTDVDTQNFSLEGELVAVIGYGSQGRAHALNLRDSGADVVVGLRPGGPSWRVASEDGHQVMPVEEAVASATIIAMLVPDMAQPALFSNLIRAQAKPGSCLMFAHGFSIHYERIKPSLDVDVTLVAPKGPGDLVRREFAAGHGVPCLFGVAQDSTGRAKGRAIAYARAIGGARGGLIETSFAEETETDLFGEQAVLCGGVKELVKAGFETLVDAGYQAEVAYFECMHELKLIVDLFYEGGLTKMHQFISETAKFGALVSGPRVVDDHVRATMRDLLDEIQSGRFAREWVDECNNGKGHYDELLAADLAHPIEQVGKDLRNRMAWLEANHG